MIGENEFILLNRRGRLESPTDWNNPQREKLWLYNLHYFDDLNAYGAESRLEWHRRLIQRWIDENPPGVGNGWEPYPTSLRVVNWIKWDLRTRELGDEAINCLGLQLRWLRRRLEYHLMGNHLLANAKALIYGGIYFDGTEAESWLRTGWRIFDEQLKEQILPDGGHFELSPMYHLIVLEDVLDVLNICWAYGLEVPEQWVEVARRMLQWGAVMCHPDGNIPFFNDAAFGVAGTYDELAEYAQRLFDYDGPRSIGSVHLSHSGYVRLENKDAVVLLDVAPLGPDYLPGHGHADTLSLELSLFGHRVLVNSGTSVYESGPERQRQRSTEAHNTVVVDGENSSEVWGGFRVARRAKLRILRCIPKSGIVVAEHDGYRRLPGEPLHRREVTLNSNSLTIRDVVIPASKANSLRKVAAMWHFHPSVKVTEANSQLLTVQTGPRFKLLIPTDVGSREASLSASGATYAVLEQSTWHPEFGRSIPTWRLMLLYEGTLPVTLETELQW